MVLVAMAVFPVRPLSAAQVSNPIANDSRKPGAEYAASVVDTPPLRLEYTLLKRVDQAIQTTQELRAIVAAMPGPDLPALKSPPPETAHFATLIEETFARLDHVEQLVNDISRLLRGLAPAVSKPAPARHGAAADGAQPKLRPPPPPVSAKTTHFLGTPITGTTWRTAALVVGGLVAAALSIYLRHRFLRTRPSRKELAARIDAPPLKDEALELADIMSSMGLADGAAQALVEHIRTNPRQALSHWLKLLDVYRKTGKQAEFESAAEKMHAAFNVEPARWNDRDRDADPDASLENYPHIAMQLKKLWPTPACGEYLLSLLADNREGKRAGFPLTVVEEIVVLLAMLRTEQDQTGLSIST